MLFFYLSDIYIIKQAFDGLCLKNRTLRLSPLYPLYIVQRIQYEQDGQDNLSYLVPN